MSTEGKPSIPPAAMVWSGRVLSGLLGMAMVASAIMKFTNSKQLVEGMTHLGWDPKVAIPLGVTELACAILYLIPQTSVIGAILLTGYMGGAIATHARLEESILLHIGFGVLFWLGLYLREPRLWRLMPWRS